MNWGLPSWNLWEKLQFSDSTCPVVGKGFVGIVVAAHRDSVRLALKIRRLDADREDLLQEAELLA
jgi:predicted Ser/Thr protein kinase